MPENNPTACLLVIGNEVLSGRTQDANIRFLASGLGDGIPLREVRVIPDVPGHHHRHGQRSAGEIRLRVHHRRHRPDARRHHQRMRRRGVRRAMGAASRSVGAHGAQLQTGRVQRRPPAHGDDAARCDVDRQCDVGGAGFPDRQCLRDGGVPRVMQSMFEWLAPRLQGGAPIVSRAVHVDRPAGGHHRRAAGRGAGEVSPISISAAIRSIGPSGNGVSIVAKGTDAAAAEAAIGGGDGDHHRASARRRYRVSRRVATISPSISH